MRKELAELKYKYKKFTATLSTTGTYKDNKGNIIVTVCLKDVTFKNEIITDHVWVKSSYHFKKIKKGDIIKFVAQVQSYFKAHNKKDYCLTNLHNIKVIKEK